jgi:hypothetical protein
MATQRKIDDESVDFEKPVIKKPENFDLEKGLEFVRKLIERNEAWVKEMAKK